MNNAINHLNLIDIKGALYLRITEYSLFSSGHGIITKRIFQNIKSLNIYKIVCIEPKSN